VTETVWSLLAGGDGENSTKSLRYKWNSYNLKFQDTAPNKEIQAAMVWLYDQNAPSKVYVAGFYRLQGCMIFNFKKSKDLPMSLCKNDQEASLSTSWPGKVSPWCGAFWTIKGCLPPWCFAKSLQASAPGTLSRGNVGWD